MFPFFPQCSTHEKSLVGQNMFAEAKMFSSEDSFVIPKKTEKGERIMKNNNQINVPQAREAMDKFKMQAASEVGVNLTNGYNGHLTSREAGSVGGQMVKKMIEAYEQGLQ